MNKEEYKLFKEFYKIKNKGWVKSLRKGYTGVGYTFETLLNKEEDNKQLPDFQNIEIKTMKYFSKRKIHLFNCIPDKSDENIIEIIKNKFGYSDKDYPEYKVFNMTIDTKSPITIGYKKMILKVNWEERKIDLICTTLYGIRMKMNVAWTFDKLEEIINIKLKKLAIVKACYKKIDGSDYFLYSRIDIYNLRDFNTFIELIDKGIIKITFKIGIWKTGEKFGEIHDRGTSFSIEEKNIDLLYKKLIS